MLGPERAPVILVALLAGIELGMEDRGDEMGRATGPTPEPPPPDGEGSARGARWGVEGLDSEAKRRGLGVPFPLGVEEPWW